MMKPRILSLTTAALAAACANPVSDPGRELGVIGSANESIVMPGGRDTVRADEPFTVTVNTFGSSSCVQPDGADVTIEPALATIVPFDRHAEPGTICTADFAARPRPVTLQFPAGRVIIRVEGLLFSNERGTTRGFVERVIEVIPSPSPDDVVTARPIGDDSLELANSSGEPIYWFAIEKGAASLALWAVCVNPATCASIPPYSVVRRPNTDIALYEKGDTEIHVYWWHLIAAGDGTFTHDSIRSFIVTLPSHDEDLSRARARWQNAAIRDYTFDFRRSCFCAPTSTRLVSITVRAGTLAGIVYADDGTPANPALFEGFLTIDEFLDYVGEAIEQSPASLQVTYDAQLGYPTSVSVDYRTQIADDEFWMQITGFRTP